ncbi:plasma membrane g-protein coupled receptor [Phlyctema vagabunda]|uniref:Plasma membrane g-protein coupled receptor n=1 Tax=Phlyctema vagabunda TaxID=108571 RepID=A0ABR4PVH8_9HELO
MAPLATGVDLIHELYHWNVQRSLGNDTTEQTEVVSPSEGNTLQVLALVFSAISVASAILAFYWFIRMRRSFRHDLIMLLIQSDMFKALWFMVYPIVTFVNGPVPNSSTFCQVNGFFLSLGIEASDFAILMIAIHSALYIFKARTSSSEGGLYPYRYIAYVMWIIFPVLMASLAFLNNSYAYVSDGTYCYLPVRPFWYRLALGWIPRYVIFIVIVSIYGSIYYYVRYKFNGFSKNANDSIGSGSGSNASVPRPSRTFQRSSLPTMPTLASHGLIPGSTSSSYVEPPLVTNQDRRKSVGSPHAETNRFIWSSFISRQNSDPTLPPTPPPSPPSNSLTPDPGSSASPSPPEPAHQPNPSISFPEQGIQRPPLRHSSWRDSLNKPLSPSEIEQSNAKHSIGNVFSALRHKPVAPELAPAITRLELVNSRGQNLAASEMHRTREKIARQLRFLFIYPLVYMIMWVPSFISHILQYTDRYAVNPPFWLMCVTTVCVCAQAAIDCWLFSTREKPWRHIPGSGGDHSFAGSFKFWAGWGEVKARRERAPHGPGKTRQEMAREARQAYKRRDEEMAQRRTGSGTFEITGPRRERSWWEGNAPDPCAMSPVTEEVHNPMDKFLTGDPSNSIAAALNDSSDRQQH